MLSLTKRLRNAHHLEKLNKSDLEKLCIEAAECIEKLALTNSKLEKDIRHLNDQMTDHKRREFSLRNKNNKLLVAQKRALQ
jgi:translation initiation factor 2B subunit (eIF-2B alpha/beta/delta family)